MPEQSVKFSTSGAVGIITLNSPETRNALTPDMMGALGDAVEQCASPNIRAVLLTGAGGSFCAGANVRQLVATLEETGTDGIAQAIRELADMLHAKVVLPLRRLPKPVVAGVNGAAAGAGFSLTLAADMRVAAQSARFLMAYANIGAPADGGSTYLLPRLLGTGRAMELYLASQPIGAPRALELGLVSQVCPDEELDRHALETATRLGVRADGRLRAGEGAVRALLGLHAGGAAGRRDRGLRPDGPNPGLPGGHQGLRRPPPALVPGTVSDQLPPACGLDLRR